MARLAALVPPPRMHLTRFHGVFAPHSKLRSAVTPAHRGVGGKAVPVDPDKPITPRHVAMSWAQRLKRVFGIEIDLCARCGGKLKVIASIEEPEVIARILAHLQKTAPDPQQAELPLGARAPPQHRAGPSRGWIGFQGRETRDLSRRSPSGGCRDLSASIAIKRQFFVGNSDGKLWWTRKFHMPKDWGRNWQKLGHSILVEFAIWALEVSPTVVCGTFLQWTKQSHGSTA